MSSHSANGEHNISQATITLSGMTIMHMSTLFYVIEGEKRHGSVVGTDATSVNQGGYDMNIDNSNATANMHRDSVAEHRHSHGVLVTTNICNYCEHFINKLNH
jgi:hypothetical protein